MRVLILTKRDLVEKLTGDNTQMRRTTGAVRELVETVTQLFIASDGSVYDDEFRPIDSSLETICRQHDVVHILPRFDIHLHRRLQGVLACRPVVVSTIFWHNNTRLQIAWQNSGAGLFNRLLSVVKIWRSGWRLHNDYRSACNVLLPNSWAEGDNVRRHMRLCKRVSIRPVPNAVAKPPFDLGSLPRPDTIPAGEYIVCPAAFAARKNQLGLIRAIRELDVPVVFLGNAMDTARQYLQACKRLATPRMLFLRHIPNDQPGYWAVLRHARCACLPSDCETPGIALLEAAVAGARPIITRHGGTAEYYGMSAEYLDPDSMCSIRLAVERGWNRGRLSSYEQQMFERFTWQWAAEETVAAYEEAIRSFSFA